MGKWIKKKIAKFLGFCVGLIIIAFMYKQGRLTKKGMLVGLIVEYIFGIAMLVLVCFFVNWIIDIWIDVANYKTIVITENQCL